MFWRSQYKDGYEDGKRIQRLNDGQEISLQQMRIDALEQRNEQLRLLLIKAQDRCDKLLDKIESMSE